MTAKHLFGRLYLLPERTATAITSWAEDKLIQELGDSRFGMATEAYYTRACQLVTPETLAPVLREQLGGEWNPEDVTRLLIRVGFYSTCPPQNSSAALLPAGPTPSNPAASPPARTKTVRIR